MPYKVLFNKHAEKQFRKLPITAQTRLAPAIRSLAAEPRPPGCRKLVGGRNHWRVRIADIYRVVYTIEDDCLLITIVEIDHRDSVYKHV